MTFVREPRILARKLWRPAMVFFALAQIILAFAPLLEGHYGRGAYSHVEGSGTHLHYAHNESDCAACLVRSLVGLPRPARQGWGLETAKVAAPPRISGA